MWKRFFPRKDPAETVPAFSLAHHFNSVAGQTLFHYTSANAAKAIIESGRFWLTDFQKTNDSSEYSYARELFDDAYANREVWIEETVRFMTTANLIGMESNTHMLIGCLTEKPDHLNQWRAYGDDGKGCVIGFDAEWLEKSAGVAIRRVNYDPLYVRKFVNLGLAAMQNMHESSPDEMLELKEFCQFFLADLYSFKHPSFEEEQEIRISRMTITNADLKLGLIDSGGSKQDGTLTDSLEIKERETQYGAARYVELPLGDNNGFSSIRCIGFGPRCPVDTFQSVKASAERVSSSIGIWKSQLPYR